MKYIGYYRKQMEKQQITTQKIILDEIESEVNSLLDYVKDVDLEDSEEALDYIEKSLNKLSKKLH